MGYVVAKYIRLSIEDVKSESMSIDTQRLLLDRLIRETLPEDVEVLEFVDNGYTGANYERPGIQELLELVRAGRIDCIVVKDFSRLGRNLIDTGYFVEQVFPLYRVRFIALGDGYDSDDNKNGIGGFDVTFKFMINELYSRDLSKKIRAAKAHQQALGEAVTKNCAFGYKLDEARKLVVDEGAALTIRLIFSLTLQGKGVSEISEQFYAEKRLIPSAYKKHKRIVFDGSREFTWSGSTIIQILHDKQYTGTYTARKSICTEVGSKRRIPTDESRWIIIPGHHEALVSHADFEAVQDILKARSRSHKKRNASKV